nr:hypothetical protein [Tanacetum cinerariifolium]
MNQILNENERLLEQVINKDIVNIVVNSSMNNAFVNVHECKKCLKLETELLNKKDFIEKETYDKIFRSYTTLEKHCISLDVDTQLNKENFQWDNSISNYNATNFDHNFELNELKAQSQEKEQCDALINQVDQKSLEMSNLNANLQEKGLIIAALKDELRKLKGKDLVDNAVTTYTIDPEMLKIDMEPIAPKLLNNRTAHFDYLKHTQEKAVILKEVVQIVLWYLDFECSKHMTGDRPQLTNFVSKLLGTVGYGDYQIGNVTISRVYYVKGLGHNLFSVRQFCD